MRTGASPARGHAGAAAHAARPRDRHRRRGQARRAARRRHRRRDVPTSLGVVDTVAGLAPPSALTYFVARLIVLAKRRLLWRVRRKLILSYIFIGFVPALLLVAFFLLCGCCCSRTSARTWCRAGCARSRDQARFVAAERRRSRFSAPAAATSRASSRGARRAAAREFPGAVDRRRAGRSRRACSERRARRGRRQRPRGRAAARDRRPWAHVEPPAECPAGSAATGSPGCWPYVARRPGDRRRRSGRRRSRRRHRLLVRARRVSRFAATRATRSSSICRSTTASGSSCGARPASS